MPLVGFGIWKVPKENAAEACYNAIKLGYRHIDGAHDYQNSKEAGSGVRKALADGLCKREELFITSKLWNNYHAKPHVLEMAKYENENWGVGYLDLVSRDEDFARTPSVAFPPVLLLTRMGLSCARVRHTQSLPRGSLIQWFI